MAIHPGDSLLHYQILDKLGEGGMGEVWRARDTTLERDVAIKVLPASVATDPERLARFDREAKVLAALNHPHIAAIHGLHEVDGQRFLAMEFVPGEDLAQRLSRGPMPLDEALACAGKIAEALEYAHERGIVHRDLKPANIKLTPDGDVKVLDFGLAKAMTQDSEPGTQDSMNSPTLTAQATQAGIIIGTAAYMAPEQARGRPVDKRADIWAFGVVLLEMLTGRALFTGETVSDVLAAVLTRDPDLTTLPPSTPAPVRRLLRRCLTRDPRTRLHDIADARIELSDDTDDAPAGAMPAPAAAPANRLGLAAPWILFVLALGAALAMWIRTPGTVSPQRTMASLMPPDGASFVVGSGFAISPDGAFVVFGARAADGVDRLWVRSLADESVRPLAGTENGRAPFWAPDSRRIGFFADSKLKKVAIDSPTVETVADAPGNRSGGTWNQQGVIVFAVGYLARVPASGGIPEEIEVDDEGDIELLSPSFLPDGSAFLYLARNYADNEPMGELRIGFLDGRTHVKVLDSDSKGELSPSGELLWWQDGNVRAQAFDEAQFRVTGESRLAQGGVQFDPRTGFGMFSVARNGTLIHRSGGVASGDELARVDRTGRDLGPIAPPGNFYSPRLSPDGLQVAVDRSDESNAGDIWIYDIERGTGTRLTTAPVDETDPIWSRDGRRITFASMQGSGHYAVHERSARGGSDETTLLARPGQAISGADWLPDGSLLVALGNSQTSRASIGVHAPAASDATPYLTASDTKRGARASSDGRFVAYDSNETGRREVYIQTFPDPDERWRVSNDGGTGPVWRSDGREIYYLDQQSNIVAVPVTMSGTAISLGTPRQLFRVELKESGNTLYDTIDGEVFLVSRRVGAVDTAPLTLAVNAFAPGRD